MEGIAAGSLAPIYGSSKKTRQRRRAKREKKGGKSGNPGLFHGSRAIFLQSHLPTFVLLKNANRKAQNDFWNQIFADYWRNWPWHLPLDQEPEDCDWSVPNTELPDVLAAKGQVIKQTQKRIRCHMRYRRTVFLRDNQNPWAPLLAALRERANPLPPSRGRSLWQLYMSKKPDEIAAVFDERWPDAGLNASDALALRSNSCCCN
ncbi:hypothetical protein VTO73DRAFT_9917, partial [Trametes versicolor]